MQHEVKKVQIFIQKYLMKKNMNFELEKGDKYSLLKSKKWKKSIVKCVKILLSGKMLSQVKDEEKKETVIVSIICFSMALKKITKEISIDI
jgi:hypothetical protein